MMSLLITGFVIGIVYAVNPDTDRVIFPGWGEYNFNSYSGYLPIGAGLRQLSYVFLESQRNPLNDPLVVWLGGGPGCSSLLGLNEEIGPFVMVDDDREFKKNPYSWNIRANILFLESPAGVGFSINIDTKYEYNDENSGQDNYQALLVWFQAFKQFQKHKFFIAGESYAGMYIPYTAKAIVEGNKQAVFKIPLEGILIGNGLLIWDAKIRRSALQEFFIRRNFLPPTTANTIRKICGVKPDSINCVLAETQFDQICLGSNINVYNIYGYCKEDTTPEFLKPKTKTTKQIRYPYVSWYEGNNFYDDDKRKAPCSDFGPINEYYNNATVQEALHILERPYFWSACSQEVNKAYNISNNGSYQILPLLSQSGIKILIYSGDQDAVISVVETEQSINMIPGIQELDSWTPWGNTDKDLAGWITQYNYLKFIVVKGAGHMVPEDQRQNAFEMFNSFIYGNELPKYH
ncbi:unnamed protein product [Paramecium primaurelia]|uniref:Carboxypeptidase n=1 Tax=Paramecium primaurelia TaxID=5886 RepID=A0A8S1PEL5_PARPR|nr:unnamed protein product [Paramecium primaurelia]